MKYALSDLKKYQCARRTKEHAEMREIVLTLYDALSAEIQKADYYYREMGERMPVKFCLSNIVAKLGSNERTKELSILIAWLLDRTE